ncbi:MAG TPA: hypothetical protein PLW93_00975 [Candidatus Absconditabacterales bacterium]|nr:hypothetical protein [Candidatus Absconditabacterales bacterium]HNG96824.1 hypothetical protein [Candidatus Absconditabacterales bacterium]
MFKRLFRLAIILILLLGVSSWTTWLDNTMIKPHLNSVQGFLQKQGRTIKGRFGPSGTGSEKEDSDSNNPTQSTQYIQSGDQLGIEDELLIGTGGSVFSDDDILGGVKSNTLSSQVLAENTQTILHEDTTIKEEDTQYINTSIKNSLRIKNCVSPRGKFIPKGGYIVAYQSSHSATCEREKRYCENGILSGSFTYDTCYYTQAITNQKTKSILSKNDIISLDQTYNILDKQDIHNNINTNTNNTSQDNNDPTMIVGIDAGPGKVINSSRTTDTLGSNKGGSTTQTSINNSYNDPSKHFIGRGAGLLELDERGWVAIKNIPRKSDRLAEQVDGFIGKTFITNTKSLESLNTYDRKICVTPWGNLISNGQFVLAFKSHNAQGGVCEVETRYCINGQLLGSFGYANCEGQYPLMVNKPIGLDLSNQGTIVGYSDTLNVIKRSMPYLDMMPQPKTTSSTTSLVYHQPDEIDHGNQPPEYQFIPILTDQGYTESVLVDTTIVSPERIQSIIYHQPDEIDHGNQPPEYQEFTLFEQQ